MNTRIADIPSGRRKWGDVRKKLIALPPGKSLVIPLDTVPKGYPISSNLLMERDGYRLHTLRLPDGIYLWLEVIKPEAAEDIRNNEQDAAAKLVERAEEIGENQR